MPAAKADKNSPEAVSKAAEEQNQKAQEEARAKIQEDEEKRLEAMRQSVGDTTTRPMDFATAAKETEALEQPPNPFNAKELEQPASVTQPPAKNVDDKTLPDELKAENVPANEGTVPSPSTQTTE
jgi:hypothetical protein